MKGFYSIWTGPFYLKHDKSESFYLNDFDLLTFILSACVWQENNGPAALHIDNKAMEYMEGLKLLDIFENGVFDLKVSDKINPRVYWAAGKLQALLNEKNPSVMIDLDLVIWKNLDEFFKGADVYGIHREYIRPEIYPSFDYFRINENYKLPKDLSEKAEPLNTAMLYISDDDFRRYYATKSLEFMENTVEENENLKHMVFAEQRLLPALADLEKKKIKTMFDHGEDIGNQPYFTHVWGHKNILKYNYAERKKFCKRILNRLKNQYSDVFEKVIVIENIKDYLDE